MKLKRRRALEVPPKIRSFISSVTAVPLENIEEALKCFTWGFDKGDFHHWVDLFNHFDSFFEKHIKVRKDLQVEDSFLDSDPSFPKEAVLQILRVIRIILENCTNKHFYSSYEQHLSSLLACTDADVVEACLQTLAAFLKKTIGKYSIRDSTLNKKLYALAQGWGGKDEGLGLIACALQRDCDPVTHELGCTLHFEFYSLDDDSSGEQGLQIIHMPNINDRSESDHELLSKLITEYKVPASLRFSLLTRLRFARAFGSLVVRQQYACIRLYAFIVLVQAAGDGEDLASFFNTEPEFVNELVSLLSFEDAVPEKIRILCLFSLVALCQERSRQPTVLTAVTSGGHRGILSSLIQKAIDSVISDSSKWSVVFAEALLSLVTVLVSSSSGCSAMREAGFIPTLLPLLKDTNPQHLHLVSTAVHILEAFMDYSNPAAALFRDLGGMDDTISRLKVEVTYVENGSKQVEEDSGSSTTVRSAQINLGASAELDDSEQPLYSEALVSYHRRLLMKSLLRAISLGTYAPGNTARVYGSEESLLPHCLCIIFKRAKDFGGGVFSLAATVMSDLIHKDPTCFPVLDAAGLPSAFLDAILGGVLCSTEAITCIPQCLDALCLNNNGLQAVKDRNALMCFVKIFTSRSYMRALTSDTPGSLSSGLDELMRHASSLRGPGVEMLIEILTSISKIGNGIDISPQVSIDPSSSTLVPMETDEDKESSKIDGLEQTTETSSDSSVANVELFLPDCVSNAARLLETILQNADTCRIFVEKKGIEAVLELFTLPLMPLSASVGQSISVAFKNFSPQQSPSLARTVCLFLREHLRSTNETLVSAAGIQLSSMESAKQTNMLRCLSSLESVLTLSIFLLKGTSSVISELGTSDADVLKELGSTYREILWQISVSNDLKSEEKGNTVQEDENAEAGSSSAASGRESDEDANANANANANTNSSVMRYMNLAPARNGGSQPLWGGESEFLSLLRSGEGGLHRRTRHPLTRIRGGRAGRHLEALAIDSETSSNVSEIPVPDLKKKSPHVLVLEILSKLASTLRSFFTALVKGFTSPNRRRAAESGSITAASKTLGSALAKIFLEAFSFSPAGTETPVSVKCRYFGKVVDDMAALTFDSRRRTCYTSMVNNFYVHGTFKELLTTFEATSQLLWDLPHHMSTDKEKTGEGSKMPNDPWLLKTLQSYCRVLEYFVNSSLLLSQTSSSQVQLLVQPVAVGLSIGLFPVPRDPEVFVRMLQSQVLDVVLPVWNNPVFANCSPGFVASIVSLVTHVYSGAGDVKRNRIGVAGSSIQRFMPPPLDEGTITTIVEMGFSRARAEEAFRRVETNSVEMAMEWLFSHPEDPVQEDDELARALALSLGSSSEASKVDPVDPVDKPADFSAEEESAKAPPVEDILTAASRLFQSSDSMAFPLTDLLVTLCNRNKGEDRPKVAAYLVQQLKLCPLDFSTDTNALSMLSHIMALLLFEDISMREIAASSGIVSAAIDILMAFKDTIKSGNEVLVPKCISALLLILDNMLQSRPRISPDSADVSVEPTAAEEKKEVSDTNEKESVFENVLGKSSGYLTAEESHRVLLVACDLMNQHVPAVIMQAVLQLCARLTKSHTLAMQFLENGGLSTLFNLPRSCFFPGYDAVASAIVRHLLEDPQTLQTAMELEIRQTLSGNRPGRVSTRSFLTSMAPVISRDPMVFLKAAVAVCQLETSGGRTTVVLSKEKEKVKATGVEAGSASNEGVRISDGKAQDGSVKCSKGHKKIPANLAQVIDQLLDIVLKFPSPKNQVSFMEVDEPASKLKGKSKVDDETSKPESESDRSAGLAKVTFVLKLLSDILLMYVHAVGVVLKRDLEMSQLRGSNQPDCSGHGGILHHVLHHLLPFTVDKSAGPDDWRDKLSEKASWFLVVLSGRSSEGRRRAINELMKVLSSFATSESSSKKGSLIPDKKVYAFIDLVYSILSKNSSSGNLPGSGCSPEIAKSMIDGGMVQCLTSILQVIDLDHPEAPKSVNLILKALESLTRAANASEQILKSDVANKRKSTLLNGRLDDPLSAPSASGVGHNNHNEEQQVRDAAENPQQNQESTHDDANRDQTPELDMDRIEVDDPTAANAPVELAMDFMPEDIEGNGLQNDDHHQIEMAFHVENRAEDEMGDEDDDMGDDDEDEDDGDDEDEDIVEDGGGMMSLGDTDGEEHEDAGLGDDYNDEMIDEEDDDDFHENRVIEVRWREALDGLDHLQVLGQPGAASGFIDVTAEPFEGVNVDDLFGLRRPLGFEHRRQTVRSSFERAVTENGFQHPLLSRPPQNGDLVSMSRDLEALSSRGFDVAHFYMFDNPALPYDHVSSSLFGDRLGNAAPLPLTDYSVGMDSLQLPGRRGLGDGRWTDDGLPQASANTAAIAQAVEEHFVAHLHAVAPPDTSETQPEAPPSNESQPSDAQLGQPTVVETEQVNSDSIPGDIEATQQPPEPMLVQPASLSGDESAATGEVSVDLQAVGDLHDVPVQIEGSSSDLLPPNNDIDMNSSDQPGEQRPTSDEPSSVQDAETNQVVGADIGEEASGANAIDPTFLEALPEDLRAEVLASQQAQSVQPPPYAPPAADDIDPEFLAALPPDIQAEVLAQQRAQRMIQQAEGQPVDMDNASIIATFPADLREEVLLTSSEAVLSALPSPLLAEAQMLRDRAMSHYQARSLYGGNHRINNRRNGLGFDRQTVMDRGVGVTIGRRTISSIADISRGKEIEGEPLVDANALKALIRLLRLAQPLGKGLLQRLLLNLCAHTVTRGILVRLLLDLTKPEAEGSSSELAAVNSQRLYGCHSNVVYGRSQLLDGLPPLVLQRILEILAYLATNHSSVASMLFFFEQSFSAQALCAANTDSKNEKGKEKIKDEINTQDGDIPLILFLKLLNRPLFLHSTSHLEQVMGLLQVVVFNAATKLEFQSKLEKKVQNAENLTTTEASDNVKKDDAISGPESNQEVKPSVAESSSQDGKKTADIYTVFLQLPQPDLRNLCILLGREGLSDKVYNLAGEVLKKLASVVIPHRKFFAVELSELAHGLSNSAVSELITLRNTQMLGLSACSMAGAAILRVLQALSSLTMLSGADNSSLEGDKEHEEHATMRKLNVVLEPLWQELSECISATETQLSQSSFSPPTPNVNVGEQIPGASSSSFLPPGTQRLLPFIEAFFVLCEKLQTNQSIVVQDRANVTALEVKELAGTSESTASDCNVTFTKFSEKHRRLLNAFIRQNTNLLEKSLSMMLKAPRLIDFDNKRAYFRSRIRQQHEQQLAGPLRISVRRAYVLEDSYNQLRMRPNQDLKGRLNVQFQGEEGIDAGGLTREWYQLLSRVIFDKGALLFTTVGNNSTFQPNPNSVFQTEHLSYFKFVGRVVAKALFDGQLLDVYFTRSFYKHILGVKVTYHDIEAVDPDYYKNLKWLLENDVNDILGLTFSMDADEEKHILYEKNLVTDYELKPGGRNIRVTEETKHEYVDLVADHILTNAIRPQINSFLEGFNELVPRELISIFNGKELELLISGLPEIDVEDLIANSEYTGYSAASSVIQWFWEAVKGFNKEDMARLLQFVTGTSKVPLEGFKALQGISGPQRFQIHKAYGAPDRLPSAHTCFNQLDLPEYTSKEQLHERLLLAIHEGSEGFGFG